MKKTIFLLFLVTLLNGCMFTKPDYLTMISAPELHQLMQHKNILLIDVHVPEQQHIKGTDLFIAFNKIEASLAKLPKNKNTPIYLYCKSGPMGNAAARTLYDLGYTHLYNLEGGADAWREQGFEFQ